jgi:hypothetical protein
LGFVVSQVQEFSDGAAARPLIAKNAMNRAQLLKFLGDSSGLMNGAPASFISPGTLFTDVV